MSTMGNGSSIIDITSQDGRAVERSNSNISHRDRTISRFGGSSSANNISCGGDDISRDATDHAGAIINNNNNHVIGSNITINVGARCDLVTGGNNIRPPPFRAPRPSPRAVIDLPDLSETYTVAETPVSAVSAKEINGDGGDVKPERGRKGSGKKSQKKGRRLLPNWTLLSGKIE